MMKQGVQTIGIVSAENPMVMQMTPEENAKRTAKFIKQLEFLSRSLCQKHWEIRK